MASKMQSRILRRRHFLQVGAIPLIGLGLPKLIASESGSSDRTSAKNIVLVWLGGGISWRQCLGDFRHEIIELLYNFNDHSSSQGFASRSFAYGACERGL